MERGDIMKIEEEKSDLFEPHEHAHRGSVRYAPAVFVIAVNRSTRWILCRRDAMNKILTTIVFLGLSCFYVLFRPSVSMAEVCYPFQLSVVTPLQIVSKEHSVCGARINLFWGSNRAVWGIDTGLFNHEQELRGIGAGVLGNRIRGPEDGPARRSWGVQAAGIFNFDSNATFTGVQAAAIVNANREASFTGIQAALLGNQNYKSEVTGLQLALFNHSQKLNGVQIGLANGVTTVEGAVGTIVLPIDLFFVTFIHFAPVPLHVDSEAHKDSSVHGAQVGLLTNITENMNGLQVSPVNYAGRSMNGIQFGFMNIGFPEVQGAQLSLWNSAGNATGVQFGGLNYAKEAKGLQVGFINICKNLKGFQIGFANIVTSRFPGSVFFAPLVNAGF
jgi:hypothetical protein